MFKAPSWVHGFTLTLSGDHLSTLCSQSWVSSFWLRNPKVSRSCLGWGALFDWQQSVACMNHCSCSSPRCGPVHGLPSGQGSWGSFWHGQLGEELHFHNQMHPFSLFVGGFSLGSGGCYSLSFPKAASVRCLLGALAWLGGRKVLKLPGNSVW